MADQTKSIIDETKFATGKFNDNLEEIDKKYLTTEVMKKLNDDFDIAKYKEEIKEKAGLNLANIENINILTSEKIGLLQLLLKQEGFQNIQITGKVDTSTKNAFEKYQKSYSPELFLKKTLSDKVLLYADNKYFFVTSDKISKYNHLIKLSDAIKSNSNDVLCIDDLLYQILHLPNVKLGIKPEFLGKLTENQKLKIIYDLNPDKTKFQSDFMYIIKNGNITDIDPLNASDIKIYNEFNIELETRLNEIKINKFSLEKDLPKSEIYGSGQIKPAGKIEIRNGLMIGTNGIDLNELDDNKVYLLINIPDGSYINNGCELRQIKGKYLKNFFNSNQSFIKKSFYSKHEEITYLDQLTPATTDSPEDILEDKKQEITIEKEKSAKIDKRLIPAKRKKEIKKIKKYQNPLDKLLNKNIIKIDGKYSASEIAQVRKGIEEETDINKFKKEINNLSDDIKAFIKNDVKKENIGALSGIIKDPQQIKCILEIFIKIKDNNSNLFQQLQNILLIGKKAIDEKGNIIEKNLTWNHILAIAQAGFSLIVNKDNKYKGTSVDGLWGVNTFRSVIIYQKLSTAYQNECKKNNKGEEKCGRPDGIIDGKTIFSLNEELGKLFQTLPPQIEPKIEPKIESKIELQIEPKLEPKIKPKIEPKLEGTTIIEPGKLKENIESQMQEILKKNPKLKENYEKIILKKGPVYCLFLDLIANESTVYNSSKINTMQQIWRNVDNLPIYTTTTHKYCTNHKNKYHKNIENFLQKICEAKFDDAQNLLDQIDKDLTEIINFFPTLITNINTQDTQLKATLNKYKLRFDQGETYAVYEFIADVMHSKMMITSKVINSFELVNFKETDKQKIQKYLKIGGQEDEINNFFKGKKFKLYQSQEMDFPEDINYGKFITKELEFCQKMNNGQIDTNYIYQKLITHILKSKEKEIISDKNISLNNQKYLELFYQKTGILDEFWTYWKSYALKGTAIFASTALTMYGGALATGGIAAKLGLGGLAIGGSRFAGGLLGLKTGSASSEMFLNGLTTDQALELFKDNWISTGIGYLLLSSINTGINSLLQSKAISQLNNGKFSFSNLAIQSSLFGAQVYSTIKVNQFVFDGELTAEEIVNTIIFVGLTQAIRPINTVKIQKNSDNKITINYDTTPTSSNNASIQNLKIKFQNIANKSTEKLTNIINKSKQIIKDLKQDNNNETIIKDLEKALLSAESKVRELNIKINRQNKELEGLHQESLNITSEISKNLVQQKISTLESLLTETENNVNYLEDIIASGYDKLQKLQK